MLAAASGEQQGQVSLSPGSLHSPMCEWLCRDRCPPKVLPGLPPLPCSPLGSGNPGHGGAEGMTLPSGLGTRSGPGSSRCSGCC